MHSQNAVTGARLLCCNSCLDFVSQTIRVDHPLYCACMQKYFLALLILAQKTNTGQQGIPVPNPEDLQSSTKRLDMPLMTLRGSSEATCLDDEPVTPSRLQVVLSV